MSALVGLELANARASLAALARSPSRLLLWAPYLLLAVLFAFQRAEAGPVLAHAFGASQVVLVGGLLLATLGMSIIAGLRNAPFTYRNRAEPFVFAVAGLNVRTICTWLQLRALAGSVGLVVGRLLYLIIIFAPRGTTARGYLGSVVALALVVALLAVIRLPVHLARNVASIPLFAIGAASAACGALLAVAGFAAQVAPSMLARWTFLTVDSTNVLHAAPTLAAAVACAAALAVGSAFFANEELLAELYRATEARIARRERATGRGARFVRRRAPAGDRAQAMRSSPTSDIPLGAFALAWLGRVEFERTSGYGRLLAAAIGAAALGLLTGAGMEAGGDGAGALLASVGTSAITVVVLLALVLVPMETARKIARDLAVPLWWIAADPLPRRLLVWSLASALPGALAAAALPLALLIALQSPLEALAAALATAILWWSIVALGLFVFTIFPNRLESRGPLMYLWMLGLVAYLFPPFAAFTIALVTARAPLVGLGAALVIVAVEGYITLQLAAGRIARHGLAIAREGR